MESLIYKLEEFEGPLDLLLQLISKNKLNIYDIKISELLEQYMIQINLMKENNMNVESEFLEMAARLVYIKTASLLPKNEEAEKLKEELTGQLLEYQECKRVANLLFGNLNLDFISRQPLDIPSDSSYKRLHSPSDIFYSYVNAIGKDKRNLPPPIESFSQIVSRKIVSVFSKAVSVLRKLYKSNETEYNSFFENTASKSDKVATFLAILELIKGKKVVISDDNKKVKLLKRQ